MTRELKQRIITSIILFIVAIFCILVNSKIFWITALAVAIISFSEWCYINYNYFSSNSWVYFLIKCLGFFYLFFPFVIGAILLRGYSFESAIFFVIVLCICIFSDIGGYVFGKTIGGKKFTKISPNKTISGSIGSFIFSILPIF